MQDKIAVNMLKNGKAAVIDEITGEMSKNGEECLMK